MASQKPFAKNNDYCLGPGPLSFSPQVASLSVNRPQSLLKAPLWSNFSNLLSELYG